MLSTATRRVLMRDVLPGPLSGIIVSITRVADALSGAYYVARARDSVQGFTNSACRTEEAARAYLAAAVDALRHAQRQAIERN